MPLGLRAKAPKSYKLQAARSHRRPTTAFLIFFSDGLTFLVILRWSASSSALQAMSTGGIFLAEAYVMRKIHKEKMKRVDGSSGEEEHGESTANVEKKKKNTSSSRFFGSAKKIHPGGLPNSDRT